MKDIIIKVMYDLLDCSEEEGSMIAEEIINKIKESSYTGEVFHQELYEGTGNYITFGDVEFNDTSYLRFKLLDTKEGKKATLIIHD